jgi:hypothetical protein
MCFTPRPSHVLVSIYAHGLNLHLPTVLATITPVPRIECVGCLVSYDLYVGIIVTMLGTIPMLCTIPVVPSRHVDVSGLSDENE